MSSERKLGAYYYGFQPTNCDAIDAILEAVARAGKGFHHTQDWNNPDEEGLSPIDKIQAAALTAAEAVRGDRERALVEALGELIEVADLRGDAELPLPADDDKLWTARMQTAWDEARQALIAHNSVGKEESNG